VYRIPQDNLKSHFVFDNTGTHCTWYPHTGLARITTCWYSIRLSTFCPNVLFRLYKLRTRRI